MKIDYDILLNAFIDVLDGCSAWEDIQYNTGLSIDRCMEIERLFDRALRQSRLEYSSERKY